MSGRRFLYHAHGSAIGGSITQPFKADIASSSATSLPIIGGFASAKEGAYQLKDVISYQSAHTYVSGIQTDDGAYNSVVTCVIEGLNILHVITADAIIGRVSSNHKDGEQAEIIPLGSSFENLKIAGQPLQVDLNHDLFMQNPTHSALLSHLESASKGNKGKNCAESQISLGAHQRKGTAGPCEGYADGTGCWLEQIQIQWSVAHQSGKTGSSGRDWRLCRGASVRVRNPYPARWQSLPRGSFCVSRYQAPHHAAG